MQSLPRLIDDRRLDIYEFFRRIYGPKWKLQLKVRCGLKLPPPPASLTRSMKRYLENFAKLEAFALPLGFETFERNRNEQRQIGTVRGNHASNECVNIVGHTRVVPKMDSKTHPFRLSIREYAKQHREFLKKVVPSVGLSIPNSGKIVSKQVPCQRRPGAISTHQVSLTAPRAKYEPHREPDFVRVPADVFWES